MRVLVIEDSPEIIESLALCFELRWPGVEVISALEGGKGLELAETESPDLVILDLGLPDMDGIDVLRRIRSFSNVPIIILTIRGEKMDKVKGLELGADDYIVKPIELVEFLSRVKAVVRRSQAPEEQADEKPLVMGKLRIDFAAREASVSGKSLDLTPKGYKVLLETLAQKDSRQTQAEEVPDILGKRQATRRRIAPTRVVLHLKSLYRLCLDKVKHRLVRLKQKLFSFIINAQLQ